MHLIQFCLVSLLIVFQGCKPESGFNSMISGQDLTSWINVNGAPETWTVSEKILTGSGKPTSILRSDQHYENFILEFNLLSTRHNNAILLIHSDALPAPGTPFPRGRKFKIGTRNPVKSAVNETKVAAENNPTKKNAAVSGEGNVRPGEWIHYRLTSRDGEIILEVNDKVILTQADVNPRKGYICLGSKGSKVVIKDIRIKELPSSDPELVATLDEGFISLFDGPELSAWELKDGHLGHWTAKDWVINYDGQSEEKNKNLWSKKEYKDFILIADIRFTRKPEMAMSPVVLANGENVLNDDGTKKEVELPYAGDTGIYVRGSSKNQVNIGNRYIGSGEIYGYRVDKTLPAEVRAAVTPNIKADRPLGEWNRFVITMKKDRITVTLNDQLVIDNAMLPGISSRGRIALQDEHANNNQFQFGNLFIKEL